MAMYHDMTSEVLDCRIGRDDAESFHGPRCLDFTRVALAASPLCP